jgi:uncharacterized protein YndB with AHSA1/START domain
VVPTRLDPAVFIPGPREEVFGYLADPRNRPEWQASLERVELLDEGEPRIGMRWVDHVRVGPTFELQIIGMEPSSMWAELGTIGPLRSFVTLLFDDEVRNGVPGTCVRIVPRVRGTRAAKPLAWAATGFMAAVVRFDTTRIVRAFEQR